MKFARSTAESLKGSVMRANAVACWTVLASTLDFNAAMAESSMEMDSLCQDA